MKKEIYNIIAIIGLVMSIIQAPLIYYFTSGFAAFFVIFPYWAIGFGLTVILLIGVFSKTIQTTLFHKRAVFIMISIGVLTVFFEENLVESIDWHLRKTTRNEIVRLIKTKEIEPSISNNIYKLDNWNFPPISNGGNEIAIFRNEKNEITVEFFINRGFLDHYSAFVYSDDPAKIQELNERLNLKKGLHINKKLDNDWYRVSY